MTTHWKLTGDGIEPPQEIAREETLVEVRKRLEDTLKRQGAGGSNQYALAVSSTAVGLTVQPDAYGAEIYVRTASVVFLKSGQAPTATQGFQADVDDVILLESRDELTKFRVIRASIDATLDVHYLRKVDS